MDIKLNECRVMLIDVDQQG